MVCQRRSLYPGHVHSWSNHSFPQINRGNAHLKHKVVYTQRKRARHTYTQGQLIQTHKISQNPNSTFWFDFYQTLLYTPERLEYTACVALCDNLAYLFWNLDAGSYSLALYG